MLVVDPFMDTWKVNLIEDLKSGMQKDFLNKLSKGLLIVIRDALLIEILSLKICFLMDKKISKLLISDLVLAFQILKR